MPDIITRNVNLVTCAECAKEFISSNKGRPRVTCSGTCRIARFRKQQRLSKYPDTLVLPDGSIKYQKKCFSCAEDFLASNPKQDYCCEKHCNTETYRRIAAQKRSHAVTN